MQRCQVCSIRSKSHRSRIRAATTTTRIHQHRTSLPSSLDDGPHAARDRTSSARQDPARISGLMQPGHGRGALPPSFNLDPIQTGRKSYLRAPPRRSRSRVGEPLRTIPTRSSGASSIRPSKCRRRSQIRAVQARASRMILARDKASDRIRLRYPYVAKLVDVARPTRFADCRDVVPCGPEAEAGMPLPLRRP
jgi:hypothetical protein